MASTEATSDGRKRSSSQQRSICYRSSAYFAQTFDAAAKMIKIEDALQDATSSKYTTQPRSTEDPCIPAFNDAFTGRKTNRSAKSLLRENALT